MININVELTQEVFDHLSSLGIAMDIISDKEVGHPVKKEHPACDITKDTLVMVRDTKSESSIPQYFNSYEEGRYKTYANGKTSSTYNLTTSWNLCKIADNPIIFYDGSGQPVPDWVEVKIITKHSYPDFLKVRCAKLWNWLNTEGGQIIAYQIIAQDIPEE